jgi:branched-subunit amino acid aminotransferase/4-amino-4-deoxychorismate lyase
MQRRPGEEEPMGVREGCAVWRVGEGGELTLLGRAADLADARRLEPEEGVYTVARTFGGRGVLRWEKHIRRLESSAALAGYPLRLDRRALARALCRAIEDLAYPETRFRIHLSPSGERHLAVEWFQAPTDDERKRGVACATDSRMLRRMPESKQSSWMSERRELAEAHREAYEVFLVGPNGGLYEGMSSNVYVVLPSSGASPAEEERRLQTSDEGILKGLSREILFEVLPANIVLDLRPPLLAERDRWLEVFLTSSSRGVLPVSMIDGARVGEGGCGPITARLQEAYDEWVEAHLADICTLGS